MVLNKFASIKNAARYILLKYCQATRSTISVVFVKTLHLHDYWHSAGIFKSCYYYKIVVLINTIHIAEA